MLLDISGTCIFFNFFGLQEGLTICFIVVEDVCYIRSCHVDRASIIFI